MPGCVTSIPHLELCGTGEDGAMQADLKAVHQENHSLVAVWLQGAAQI